MSSELNEKLASLVSEEIWNKGNLKVAEEILTQDIVRNDSNWPEVRGLEMYKQTVVLARTAFPDWHEIIHDMVSEGDKVACRITILGTHKGDLLGNPPTGKSFSVPCHVMYRIERSKIAEMWTIWDALSLFGALGVSPPSPPKR
jgi:steroid delta-isomerase-like uncharacterized protein